MKKHLTSGDDPDSPVGQHVHLHLYEIELTEEPLLNPDYYADSAWLTAEEYEKISSGQPCGLCLRLWSDYAWMAGITDRLDKPNLSHYWNLYSFKDDAVEPRFSLSEVVGPRHAHVLNLRIGGSDLKKTAFVRKHAGWLAALIGTVRANGANGSSGDLSGAVLVPSSDVLHLDADCSRAKRSRNAVKVEQFDAELGRAELSLCMSCLGGGGNGRRKRARR